MTLMDEISSILGLIPLNSTNVTKFPDAEDSSSFYSILIYITHAIGIPISLLVMYLSFIDRTIKKNYKYLLGNMAVCNFFVLVGDLVSVLVHKYVVDNELLYTPFRCTLREIWAQTFGACYYNSVPLVSIHRYMIVVHKMDNFFTNKIILCMCLSVYWPILYPILAFASPSHLLRDNCGYMYWFPFIREFLLVPVIILSLASVFCIIKFYLFLRKHIKTEIVQRNLLKLQDERSLLKAMIIQGIIPLVCCVPNAILLILVTLFNNQIDLGNVFGITFFELLAHIVAFLFYSYVAFDGLLTLICVPPYRMIIICWWQKYLQCKSTVQTFITVIE